MANGFYIPWKNSYLTQAANQVDFDADTLKLVLIDAADYVVDLTNHDFFNDVAAAARVATATLTGVTVTGATVDAADVTFTAVSGDVSEALLLYKDTGVETTSRLVLYIDTASGLPVTPNGGDISVIFDNGANKVFSL